VGYTQRRAAAAPPSAGREVAITLRRPLPQHVKPYRRLLEQSHKTLVVIDLIEDVMHYVIASLLLVVAGVVLYDTGTTLLANRDNLGLLATDAINDLLFVVIVLELLRTVVAHLESDDFQLRPFIIIGIIVAVRHILAVDARLTLIQKTTDVQFRRSMIELGVSAGVVLALALGLLLVNRTGTESASRR
jgi:uncharacterized membrane protein (DUF373 family)